MAPVIMLSPTKEYGLTAKVSVRIHMDYLWYARRPYGGWTAGVTLVQTASHMAASIWQQVYGGKYMTASISCGSKYMAASIWQQVYGGKYMAASMSCGSKYMAASIWQQDHRAPVSRYRQQAWAESSPGHSMAASTWQQVYHMAASISCGSKHMVASTWQVASLGRKLSRPQPLATGSCQ